MYTYATADLEPKGNNQVNECIFNNDEFDSEDNDESTKNECPDYLKKLLQKNLIFIVCVPAHIDPNNKNIKLKDELLIKFLVEMQNFPSLDNTIKLHLFHCNSLYF
ncbi:hypothetical protein BpHYR1_026757 [Brachionus plicatilis]|uniref:Uncharacterized protein n=1 Tax=Brachionus plicatilis TaxID=10195 RepID=A0A3M7R1F2_BRAPC|nr:hypothetical protein BpHYR1_026757 [Brachionus plicatilis]